MDLHDTIRTYRLFSGSYDIVFGPVFHPGRKAAVRIAAEMPRVCIPAGTIVVVNHFTSENLPARFIEKRLAGLARHIGFHADFPFDAFRRDSQLSIREVRPSNLFGYWKLLRCVNEKPASNPS